MKPKIKLLVLLMMLVLVSCKKKPPVPEWVPPLSINIPIVLENLPEVVHYIKESEKTINEFSATIEKINQENYQIISKTDQNMSMGDKIKFMAVAGQVSMCHNEFANNYVTINTQIISLKSSLPEEQLSALLTVEQIFESRKNQLEDILKQFQFDQ